jgi:N-acetyl-gamma-glutamyl-phosphate reductase
MSHPAAEIRCITSRSYPEKSYSEVFPNFLQHTSLVLKDENIEEIADECDVIFLALPHGIASEKVSEDLLKRTRIIDLGADFRLSKAGVYEKWYGVTHKTKMLLPKAVYGLTELNRDHIKSARLIANPGCYTTCGILALYPLLKEGIINPDEIIIDAKSGVTGAGRGLDLGVHFSEANENIKAYKVGNHRHTPELEEQLSLAAGKSITLSFTPHLIPMNRGILITAYGKLSKDFSHDDIREIYNKYYQNEYFIRIHAKDSLPETKWIKASNFCDIGFTMDKRTGRVVVVSALDNLVKGAAGQAIQNMNTIFRLDEKSGLDLLPAFPI